MKMKFLEKDILSLLHTLSLTEAEQEELEPIFRSAPFYLAVQIASYQNKRIAALYQLIQHYIETSMQRSPVMLRSPEDVYDYFAPYLAPKMHEELWLAIVDAKLQIRAVFLISRGDHESTPTCIDKIFTYLEQSQAKWFFLVHNHPSGDPSPSKEDRAFTQAIRKLAHQKGFELVDHIIIGQFHPDEDGTPPFYSFTLSGG